MIYTIQKKSLNDIMYECYNEINDIYENYIIESYDYLYESEENDSTEKKGIIKRVIEVIKGIFKAIGRAIDRIISFITGKNKNREKDIEHKVEEVNKAIKEKEDRDRKEGSVNKTEDESNSPKRAMAKFSMYPKENFVKLEKEISKLCDIVQNLGENNIDEKLRSIDSDMNSYPMKTYECPLYEAITKVLVDPSGAYSLGITSLYNQIKKYCDGILNPKSSVLPNKSIYDEIDAILDDFHVDAPSTSNMSTEEIKEIPKQLKDNAQKVIDMANKLMSINNKMSDYNYNIFTNCANNCIKIAKSIT